MVAACRRTKFIAASGSEMLNSLEKLHNEIEDLRTNLESGEADPKDAADRALRGLQELISVIQPLARAHKKVHG
jgi:hypothetical protein